MYEDPVITAVNSVTSVGFDAVSTAAAVRAGVSGLAEADWFTDVGGESITAAVVPDLRFVDTPIGQFSLGSERMVALARLCLEGLLSASLSASNLDSAKVKVVLGLARSERPGPTEQGQHAAIAGQLIDIVHGRVPVAEFDVIQSGNPSSIDGVKLAVEWLRAHTTGICIVGSTDSLLTLDTLFWLERGRRLKSGSHGRNHGLPPGEAAAFFVIEDAEVARWRGRQSLVALAGVGCAHEEAYFMSNNHSVGIGLTTACRQAVAETNWPSWEVDAVLGDLNGEFHRSKEWGLTELRCFGSNGDQRQVWHPADCYGDIGAASAAALLNLAAVGISRGWLGDKVMVFSSDDFGSCGAALLTRAATEGPVR